MRNGVVDIGISVDRLLLVDDAHAAERQFGVLAVEGRVVVAAGYPVVQHDAVDQYIRPGPLVHEHRGHLGRILRRLFHVVVVEHGIVVDKYLAHLRGEETHRRLVGVVAHQQFGLGTLAYDNEQPAVDHEVDVTPQYIHQLDGLLDHHPVGDIEEESVLSKGGVERHRAVAFHVGGLPVVAGYQLRILPGHLAQAAGHDPLGQLGRSGLCLGVEGIVHDKVEQRAQVGHITTEHFVGIDFDIDPAQVQPVVGSVERLDVGAAILLVLERGQPLALEQSHRLVAQGIHHRRRMARNQVLLRMV